MGLWFMPRMPGCMAAWQTSGTSSAPFSQCLCICVLDKQSCQVNHRTHKRLRIPARDERVEPDKAE